MLWWTNMQSIEKVTIPVELRRLVISESTYLGLEDIAAEKRKTADEIIKPLITPKSIAQKLLALAVEANRRKR
jgi:hypothetical protein